MQTERRREDRNIPPFSDAPKSQGRLFLSSVMQAGLLVLAGLVVLL